MLQKQLDRSNAIFKIVPAVLAGFMGLLTCGQLGLRAYLISLQARDDYLYGYSGSRLDFYNILAISQKYSAAYYALYFVTIIASGGLALTTIMSLRKAGKAGGDLIGWSIALTLAMMLWVIILIVFAAWSLDDDADYTYEKSIALSYVLNFGQALSCIFILCIAKHASWRKPAHLEQYGQNVNHNGQPYYHQAPEFVGNTHTVKP